MAAKFKIFCDELQSGDKQKTLGPSIKAIPGNHQMVTSAPAAAAVAAAVNNLAGTNNASQAPINQPPILPSVGPLGNAAAVLSAAGGGNNNQKLLLNHPNNDLKREPLALKQQPMGHHALKPSATNHNNHHHLNHYHNHNRNNHHPAPLGLQANGTAIHHHHHHHQQQQTTAATTSTLLNTSTSNDSTTTTSASNITNTSTDEEDQENDISMASLGSDFVPSILHDENQYDDNFDIDQSFELDEDEDFEADQELKLELSKAFKEHDKSQLAKNIPYIDEIRNYLFALEREPDLRPLPNYIDFQDDIDSKKRATLIKWLVEVSDEYELETETLFISISIIDRFLSKMAIPVNNFQLLGAAAMFIASKYEEIYPPVLKQFVELTDDTCPGDQIRQMEQEILKALDFRISVPTISYFLSQIFVFNKFSRKVYDLAEYLCYLSLVVDQPFLEYYPSEIATAAVILAAHELDAKANISSDLWSAYDKSITDQLNRRRQPQQQSPPSSPTSSSSLSSPHLSDNKKTKITTTPPSMKKPKQPLQEIDRRTCIMDNDLPLCIEALLAIQKRAHKNLTAALHDSSITMDDSIIQKFLLASHNGVALLAPPEDENSLLSLHKRE